MNVLINYKKARLRNCPLHTATMIKGEQDKSKAGSPPILPEFYSADTTCGIVMFFALSLDTPLILLHMVVFIRIHLTQSTPMWVRFGPFLKNRFGRREVGIVLKHPLFILLMKRRVRRTRIIYKCRQLSRTYNFKVIFETVREMFLIG